MLHIHTCAAFDISALVAIREQRHIVQLAEPFDGVDRSPLLTPLIARHIQQKWGALAVTQVSWHLKLSHV